MRVSSDLRKRVVDFVCGGESKAEAARRLGVGEASVYRWLKASDLLAYEKPGPRAGWRLKREALRAHVEEYNDMSYVHGRGTSACPRAVFATAFARCKITRKKNDEVCRA
jgi:excisionase family DNA binding protein